MKHEHSKPDLKLSLPMIDLHGLSLRPATLPCHRSNIVLAADLAHPDPAAHGWTEFLPATKIASCYVGLESCFSLCISSASSI